MQKTRFFFMLLIGMFFLTVSVAQAALYDMVPLDSPFIMNVNVARLMKVAFIKKMIDDGFNKQTTKQIESYNMFVAKTGLDPRKHFDNIMIFTRQAKDPMTGKIQAGLLCDGNFDTGQLIAAIHGDKQLSTQLELENFHGFNAFTGAAGGSGRGVFLDASTMAFGNPAVLKGVTDVVNGKTKGLAKNKAFFALLQNANKAAAIWGGVLVSSGWKKEAMSSPMSAPLANLKSIFFSLDYEKTFIFNLTGKVAAGKKVSQIRQAFQNYLDALKGWGAGTPEFLQLLKMATVTADKDSASINLTVKKDVFESLMTKLAKRAQSKK